MYPTSTARRELQPRPQAVRLAGRALPLLGLMAAMICPPAARAQLLYWDSNADTAGAGATPTGIWGTDAFWSTDPLGLLATAAWTPGATAIFSAGSDASGAVTVTVLATQTAAAIIVEEGAVTLATGTASIGAGNVTVNSGATLVTDSSLRIAATAGATMTVNGGTVQTINAGAAGTFVDADFVITLGAAGGIFSYTIPNVLNIVQTASKITGPGSLTKTGVGVLAFAGTVGNNDYSGGTIVSDGELRIRTVPNTLPITTAMTVTSPGILNLNSVGQKIGSLTGNGLVGFGAATLLISNTTSTIFDGALKNIANAGASGVTTGNGRLSKDGPGAITFNGQNDINGSVTLSNGVINVSPGASLCGPIADLIVNGGVLNLSNVAQIIENLSSTQPTGTIHLATGHTLIASNVANSAFSGSITGAGGILKLNNGVTQRTLTFTGTNSYDGNTIINGGNISVGSATALGSTVGYTEVASGMEVIFTGATTTFNCAEPFRLAGPGGSDAGAIAVLASANPTISGPITLLGDTTITVSSSASATLNNPAAITSLANQNLTLQGGANAAGLKAITGVINLGSGGLTKLQSGEWVLSGANVYSGPTTIGAGTLRVANTTGSATGSGAVTVASGATLAGSGLIAGSVSVTGTLAAGSSPGTITTGDEIWNGGGTLAWEINDAAGSAGANPGWDLVNIAGTLTITATPASKFNINVRSLTLANALGDAANFNNTQDYIWTLVTASGGISGFDVTAFNLNTTTFSNAVGSGQFLLEQSGNSIRLRVVHPATIACPANFTQNTDPGLCTSAVTWVTPTTGSAPVDVLCKVSGGVLPVNLPVASPYSFPKGTTTVTCTATNLHGTNACSFDVTVNDAEAPVIGACPATITVLSNVMGGAVAMFSTPGATDNCPPVPTVVCVPVSGSTFAVGTNTVTCTATDGASLTNACTFSVVVVAPVSTPVSIVCPANFSLLTTGAVPVVVNFTSVVSGGVSPVMYCVPPSGFSFPVGTSTVSCVVLDGAISSCVVPDNGSGSAALPPAGCAYQNTNGVFNIVDGLPMGSAINIDGTLGSFSCPVGPSPVCSFPAPTPGSICYQPGGGLSGEQQCANATLLFNMSGTGGLSGFSRVINIPFSIEMNSAPRTNGQPIQSFATELFRAFGQITGDPDFDLLRVVGGTDFGLPSPGHTTLIQRPGNTWAVDSFFDITYRIDFVGRSGGALSGQSGSTTGTVRIRTGTPAPAAGCSFAVVVNDYVPVTGLQALINAANPGDTIVVVPGTYAGVTVNKNLTLDCSGGGVVITGASPALTLTMGSLSVTGGTFTTVTDDPTILVTGGALKLRSVLVEESGFLQSAISVTGGTLDLGVAGDLGGNTIKLIMAGTLLTNGTTAAISALGNTWQQDATPLTSNFDIEDKIFHNLDDATRGLVTYVANNVYVTTGSGSIQRGIDAVASGGRVNVKSGAYPGNADATANAITLAPGASPGQVVVNGNLTLDGNDSLEFELNGLTPGADHDQIVVNGLVTLGGAAFTSTAGFAYADCVILTLIDNDGVDPVSGTFSGLADGAVVVISGQGFRIFYNRGDGNDVVLVKDTTPPAIDCGLSQTVECGTAWNFAVASITDNCDPTPTLNIVSTATNATCGNTYVATRVWQGTDASGNSMSCTQVVMVVDTIVPLVTCPASITLKTYNLAGEVATFSASATDACNPGPLVACVPASGSTFPIGITSVACTAVDVCNNTNSCSFNVTVLLRSTTNYLVGAQIPDGNINGLASTKEFSSAIGIVTDVNVTFKTTGGYNGDLYVYLVHDSGFSVLLNRVGRSTTDSFGYGDAGFNVTLDDTAANNDIHVYRYTLFTDHNIPVGGPLTNSWIPDGRAADPLTVVIGDPSTELLSSFNGLNPNGSWTLFAADLSPVDIATLDSWGLDICGLLPIPASITTQPSSLTVECSSNLTFTVTTAGTAPLTNQWYYNGTPILGATGTSLILTSLHPVNSGTYTFVVGNMANYATSAPIVLNVFDTIIPTITTCATNATLAAGVACSILLPDLAPQVVASDACSAVTISQVPAAGTTLGLGVTVVTLTVTDLAGNTNACTATITVIDATPPSITCPADIVAGTDAAQCSKTNVTFTATASDNCPGVALVCVPASDSTFPKGVTTVTCTATDGAANTNACTFTVTINDLELPALACPANISTNITVGCTTPVDFAPAVTDNCPGVVSNCVPASGSTFSLGTTTVNCTATDASGNINTCNFTVTVNAAAPSITAQPLNQTTPMGNGAVFSVTATGTATLTYQWYSNNVPVVGGVGSSLAVSNVTLANSGDGYRVEVSNCAGTSGSVVATLTVTPVAGIAFDFNVPGQFTNQQYAMAANNWINTAVPAVPFEVSTGGVGVATGGGALDLTSGSGDNGSTLMPLNFDFSLPGRTLYASAMVKVKVPTANNRAIQLGFITTTNINNALQQINSSSGQGFMSVILQSTIQPAAGYMLRAQHKVVPGGTTVEVIPVNSPTNLLATNQWYKLVAKFVNVKGAAGSVTASNFTVEATLQAMGVDGLTPGAVVLGMVPLLQTNVDLVGASRLFFCVRTAAEAAGMNYVDNIYAHTTNGPVVFVQEPQSQGVAAGRVVTLRALVDGDGPYSYQWQQTNGAGGFADVPGARSWNFRTPPVAALTAYRVVVTGPANTVTSAPAVLTVLPEALAVTGVGSVEGSSVGVRFNQAVDPVTAANPAFYTINGQPAAAARLYYSPTDLSGVVQDGTRVLVTPAVSFAGAFTVTVNGVQDLAGAAMNQTVGGVVAGLTGADVNPYVTQPSGQQHSFGAGQFEITGGGQDISGNADSFRYVYTQRTGDFDVKARVPFLDVVRTSTKAGFDVRTSLDPFAPSVLASVISQLPARNLAEGVVRQNYNTASATWGTSVAHAAGFPNVWVRLRRVGNNFLRYSSTNGVDWRLEAQIAPNPVLPATVYYGLAVCGTVGNAAGLPATAWFENYGDFAGYPGATDIGIVLQPVDAVISAPGAATLTVAAQLTNGPALELAFTWQRSDGAGGWTNMPNGGTTTATAAGVASTNVLNTGALYGNDDGAQYRVIASAPGALSATSLVAVVTVTDGAAPAITAAFVPTNSVRQIVLVYSEPMSPSALVPANYAVTNGAGAAFGVAGAVFLNGDPRVVQLTTVSALAAGAYGVLINGVEDRNPVPNPLAPNTVALVFQMGYGVDQMPFVVDFYGGLPTAAGAITNLGNTLKFAGGSHVYNAPDFINYSNVFGVNVGAAAFPGILDGYGVRIYSYFVPPASGAYKFYLRADEFGQFWMNTNVNPALSILPPDTIIASSNASPPVAFNMPVAQQAMFAFDNVTATKYLNFNRPNHGAIVVPAMGASVVKALRLTTAEDAPERDPLTYTLEGTTGHPASGPWTLIASGDTGLPTTRLTAVTTPAFANTTAYTSYRLLFPTLRNLPAAANSIQISEIELLDAGGADVTGRGAFRQLDIGNNAAYTAVNSYTTPPLNAGQRYYVEVRMTEGTGTDGVTMAVRPAADAAIPAATEVASGVQFAFPSGVAPATPVQMELYTGMVQGNGVANGRIEDLLSASAEPRFIARLANITGYEKQFGCSTNLANFGFDNYLGRLYAHFIAPSNGLYKFYIRADDSAQLWMNTNATGNTNPAGISLLGYTERFINANYWLIAENVSLVGGRRYYMEGRWREGTGGDGMTVTYRAQNDATTPLTTESIPASQLELATNLVRFGPVTVAGITPFNPTVNVGETITFQAQGIGGTPPYGFFWLKNGVQVMANNPIYTNPPVTLADNGAVFTLVVTNPWSRAEVSSTNTVLADGAPPAFVNAVGSQYQEFVTVTFDGPVDPTSAACLANYAINNGVQVLAVAYDGGRGNRVSLRTTVQTPGTPYVVTVNGVKDRAGNVIAANSTNGFTAWTWGGCGYLAEFFTNITGGAVDNLVKDYKYLNNLPDSGHYTNLFGAGQFGADSGFNNYGVRVSAYAVPPATGLYRFYIRGDDGTQLFMNTNGPDARARVMIARSDSSASGTYFNGLGLGVAGASISPVVRLTNGTAYYVEALLKEGGGSDYVQVLFRAVDPNTLLDLPAAPGAPAAAELGPVVNNIFLPGFFAAPGNPDTLQLLVTQSPPEDLYYMVGDGVSLAVLATTVPPSAILSTCYQWQRETAPGSGLFTNIPGAVLPALPAFPAMMSDNGLKYRLYVGLPVPRTITTTLHVLANGIGPVIMSASSLNGTNINLCFNELVDPVSAVDPFNYTINGDTVITVIEGGSFVRPDGRSVSLVLSSPLPGPDFTIEAAGVEALQPPGLFTSSLVSGRVQGYVPLDVGAPPGPGSSFSCKVGEIDVVAGGANFTGTSDQGHVTLRPISGNFDIWARVQRLDRAAGDNDGITRAGLMVRENFDANARNMHALVEPPAALGGRDSIEAGQRPFIAGATAAWNGGTGTTLYQGPVGIPNAWVRLKRTGNRFEAFRSLDGVNWLLATTNNVTYSNTVLAGFATTAHVPFMGGAAGSIYGNANVTTNQGVGDSGVLHLTEAVNNHAGSLVLNDLTPGKAVASFTASFALQIGSGSADGADGFCFNLASDLPNAATGATGAEDGIGTGLSICVDNYSGGTTPAGPQIRIKYGGVFIAHQAIPKWNSPSFVPVSITLAAGGAVTVTMDGTNVFSAVATPYVPVAGRFGLYARTGGLNQRHWVDNLAINVIAVDSTPGAYFADFNSLAAGATTFAEYRDIHFPSPPTILVGPASQTVAVSTPVTFTVTATNPASAGPLTYQWQLNGNDLPGATGSSLVLAAAQVAGAGAYTVQVGNDGGSVPATAYLTVLNLPPVVASDMIMATQNTVRVVAAAELLGNDPGDPEGVPLSLLGVSGVYPGIFNANFNDGLLPAGTALFGNILGAPSGTRIGDDGTGTNQCVHLVDNRNLSSFGVYTIPDLSGGKTVNALQARWRSRIGGASDGGVQNNRPGADGLSFNWANNLPANPLNGPFYEDGVGTGLSVTVDTWDGGAAIERGGLGVGIEIAWQNTRVAFDYINADQGLAKDFLRKDRFVDVALTVTPEGLATFTYDGMTLSAQLPGYTGIAGGRYLFGTHTGSAYDNHWVDDISILALTRDTALTMYNSATVTYASDFNSGNPAGASLYGNAYVSNQTGTANSGALHLTDAANSLAGSFVINDLAAGKPISAFTATMNVRIGNGTGNAADGMSFNLANDLPNAATGATVAEEGLGSGFSVAIDNYPTGGADSPSIKLKWGGALVGIVLVPKWNNVNWIPVTIQMDPDGTVDVRIDGTNVFANHPTPFQPVAGRFGFYGRTGGENETHWVDDLALTVTVADNASGQVVLSNGQVIYTPPTNGCGMDTWYYVATDGQQDGYAIGRVDVQIKEAVPAPPVIVFCPTNRNLVLPGGQCEYPLPDLTGEILATDNCCCLSNSQSPAPGTPLAIGLHTITFTVTDTMGSNATCTAQVTVVDVTPPDIACSTNITAECTGPAGALVGYSVTATDDCNVSPPVICVPPSGTLFANGTTTVNCTTDDGNGNMAGCAFTISVVDRTPPLVTCPANILVNLGAGQCDATVSYAPPAYVDCDIAALVVCTPLSGSLFPAGTNTVNCTVTDLSNHVSACSFRVVVLENVKPAIVCPPDLVIECGNDTLPPATGVATATDNCDTSIAITYLDHGTVEVSPGSLGGWVLSAVGDPLTASSTFVNGPSPAPIGTGSLRLAVGSNGDAVAQARTTNFHGTRLSALTELSFRTYVTASSGNGETPFLLLNIDTDGNGIADDVIGFESEYQSGYTVAVPDQGLVANGLWQSWNAMVGGWWSINHPGVMSDGNDVQPLAIYIAAFPNARIVNASSGAGGVRLVAGQSFGTWENFDGNVDRFTLGVNGESTVTDFDLTPGDVNPIPLIVRTWTARDDSGNAISCSQLIRVVDTTPPVLACPASLLVKTTNPAGDIVNYVVTASDVCDPNPTMVCVPPAGSFFVMGSTPVGCVLTDLSGNGTACNFVVTLNLVDGTNYTVNAPIPDNDANGFASTKTVASQIGILTDVNVHLNISGGYNGDLYAYLVHDSGFSVLLNRVGRRTGEPAGYSDAGFNVTFDDQSTNGDVHVYRMTLFGNNTTPLAGSLTNSWRPDGRATDPGLVLDSDPRTELLNSFNGLNPNGEWTLFIADVGSIDTSTLVSWSLDLCGLPPIPPSITLQPANQTVECSSNVTFTVAASGTPPLTNQWYRNGTAIPGANGSSLTFSSTGAGNGDLYKAVVNGMGGSVTSAPATLTVVDTIAPVVVCPGNITAECATPAGTVVSFSVTVIESCSVGLAAACVPPSGSVFPPGLTTVNCSATDAANNAGNTCSFTVQVVDTTPPAFCNNPAIVLSAGVTNDNFAGVDAAAPSQDLEDYLFSLDLRDFDDGGSDRWFAHTFVNLPANISDAVLRIRIRGDLGVPQNDAIQLLFTTPGGGLLPASWSRRIGTGGFDAVPGILPTPWAAGSVTELVLDLSHLRNEDNSFTDLLPTLRAQGYLDITVQDDTDVDYAVLEIRTCQCQTNIIVNVNPQTCGAIVNFTAPVFADDCDTSLVVACVPASGTQFPVGTTDVFCTATDDSGNIGRCAFSVVVAEPAPALRIEPAGANVLLSWPVTCAEYRLLSAPSLNPPVIWTPVSAPISISGGEYHVLQPASGPHRFYRLVTP